MAEEAVDLLSALEGPHHLADLEGGVGIAQGIEDEEGSGRGQGQDGPLLGQGQPAGEGLADAVRVGDIGLEGADRDHRHRGADARVQRRQPHGLVAAAAGAGDAEAFRVDHGQALQEVQAALVVPDLGAEEGLAEAEQPRADLGAVVLVLARLRAAFARAEGVDDECDEALACQDMPARGHPRRDLAL